MSGVADYDPNAGTLGGVPRDLVGSRFPQSLGDESLEYDLGGQTADPVLTRETAFPSMNQVVPDGGWVPFLSMETVAYPSNLFGDTQDGKSQMVLAGYSEVRLVLQQLNTSGAAYTSQYYNTTTNAWTNLGAAFTIGGSTATPYVSDWGAIDPDAIAQGEVAIRVLDTGTTGATDVAFCAIQFRGGSVTVVSLTGTTGPQGPKGDTGAPGNYTTIDVSTDYTVPSGYYEVGVDASGGARNLILPPAASFIGQPIYVSKIDSSANLVNLLTSGTDVLQSPVNAIAAQYDALRFYATASGTAWRVS